MYSNFKLYRMMYKSKLLCYRLCIGNQCFDIDVDIFQRLYPNILNEIVPTKDLKILKDVLVLEDILKGEGKAIVIDVSNDDEFLNYLSSSLDMSKYMVGIDIDEKKGYEKYFNTDKVIEGSQLGLLLDIEDTVGSGLLLEEGNSIGGYRTISSDDEYRKALELYGVLLDRSYKVGAIDNILDEPSLVNFSNSTRLKYKPLYDKHRRFFSNVVFLVDHVKTTTGGVKAKKIRYSLLNDVRFKKATNSFLEDIKGGIDYNRIRVWYSIATGRDMLEGKIKFNSGER